MTGSVAPIRAARVMPLPHVDVHAVLADLNRHWELSDAFEVLEVRSSGLGSAVVRLHGPGSVRRTVRTVVEAIEENRISGVAEAGATRARVEWTLEQMGPRWTRVEIEIRLERASAADRTVLALGAAWWIQRRLKDALAELERVVAEAPGATPAARP